MQEAGGSHGTRPEDDPAWAAGAAGPYGEAGEGHAAGPFYAGTRPGAEPAGYHPHGYGYGAPGYGVPGYGPPGGGAGPGPTGQEAASGVVHGVHGAGPAGSFRDPSQQDPAEGDTGGQDPPGYGPDSYAADHEEPGGAEHYPAQTYGAPVGYPTAERAHDVPQPGPAAEPEFWPEESAASLTDDFLMPGRHPAPTHGWRRLLYQASGGLVRAPESAAERRREELVIRARTPVANGHHRVAVLSLKGGVGKTTTTVGLGSTLASVRGDRVIAVDANPDRGTLCDKLRLETSATVRDLLNERDQIQRYADVRAYTTQAASRLEVLASDRDPTVSVAFGAEDYETVARVLEHYYSICVTDCGTGLLHSAMAGVLRLADQIVLVSSPSVDGARSASATLDWLAAHNYGDLVRSAVVVLSALRPRSKSTVDLARLEQHFASRCRAVVRVPYDPHLEEGAEVDLEQLSRATADAYLVLAAEVGDGFAARRYTPGRTA